MKETQEERILRVIDEAKKAGATLTDADRKEYEGLKAVDLFNATVSGAIAKLDTFSKLYGLTANLPQETPEEVVKSLATLLEAITREEMNGIADCLLTVVACEPETKVNEQERQEEKETRDVIDEAEHFRDNFCEYSLAPQMLDRSRI